jgi:hypothetical protein
MRWVNCLKTLNKLTMCLPGKTPSAPSDNWPISAQPNTPNVGWGGCGGCQGVWGQKRWSNCASSAPGTAGAPALNASSFQPPPRLQCFRTAASARKLKVGILVAGFAPNPLVPPPQYIGLVYFHPPKSVRCLPRFQSTNPILLVTPMHWVGLQVWLRDKAVSLGRISQHELTHGTLHSFCLPATNIYPQDEYPLVGVCTELIFARTPVPVD